MNTSSSEGSLEARLRRAAAIAAPAHSIADDLLRRLPDAPSRPLPRARWKLPALAAGLTGIAALLAIAFLLLGNNVRLTLADVQSAVENQKWIHVRYDAGAIKEEWTNLRTGETYVIHFAGNRIYLNEQTNTRLWYWKDSGVISQDTPVQCAPGQSPPPWSPRSAWESLVAPLEKAAAATRPAGSPPFTTSANDILNGKAVIRFDNYGLDALGKRLLYSQLWADPRTHLPLRIKIRLQLGQREQDHKDFSTGDYDFPTTGPADIYALGVPAGAPIQKEVTTAPASVEPILEAINHAHDNFLKHYRATVIGFRAIFHTDKPLKSDLVPSDNIEAIDVIWRNGDTVRHDHHLPAFELQENPTPVFPREFTIENLLRWTTQREPIQKQLLTPDREYSWTAAIVAKTPKPQVHVIRHQSFPLLATNSWPESIQWPSRYDAPAFQLLPINPETPRDSIGLRLGGEGNSRSDFYVDPQNDYICIKTIRWEKRAGTWTKESEVTLTDIHRIAGFAVAATQFTHSFGDPTQHLSPNDFVTTIDVHPLTQADYPKNIFDPAALTTGANVEGY